MPTERIIRKGIRDCVRLFSPAWFTINMGTGTLSNLAANFHFGYGSIPLKIISLTFFFINLSLFLVFVLLSLARYSLFPKMWFEMLSNPAEGLFIGSFPIGSATLIDLMLIANQRWGFSGNAFLFALWVFWWIVLGISYLTTFGMIYVLMSTRHHLIKETTSVWVLPIIPLIVLSATGGSIANALMPISSTLGILTTAFSLASFCIGMGLTLMIITLYLTRLILRGSPPKRVVMASFIIASPLGQGGSSLLINGDNLLRIFSPPHISDALLFTDEAGQQLYVVCFAGAWCLWAMALCWVILSMISIYGTSRRDKIPFTMSYWGIVFPNGVLALCSVRLGTILQSPFYNYFGAIWSCIVLVLWAAGMILTIRYVWDTSLFQEVDHEPPEMVIPSRDGLRYE